MDVNLNAEKYYVNLFSKDLVAGLLSAENKNAQA